MDDDRISYHESVRKVYERIKKDGMTNIWDRYEAQGMGGNPDQRVPSAWPGPAATCAPTAPAGPMPPRTSGASAASPPTAWPCA